MAAAYRRMVQLPVYVTPEQVDELYAHAERLRVPAAAIVRAGIDGANAELRSAPPGELPVRLRNQLSKHGRRDVRVTPRRHRAAK